MPVHVSFGRATCAGHKQKYVRNELVIPSTQLGTQMHSLAWLGQGLCPAQHAISMSRGPPTTPTTAALRRRGRVSTGGSVERAVVATGRRQVAAFRSVNWYWPENILDDIFLFFFVNRRSDTDSTAVNLANFQKWPMNLVRAGRYHRGSNERPSELIYIIYIIIICTWMFHTHTRVCTRV